jgi:hypothetical protein
MDRFTPKPIYTDLKAYNSQLEKYNIFLKAKKEVLKIFKQITGSNHIDISTLEGAIQTEFFKLDLTKPSIKKKVNLFFEAYDQLQIVNEPSEGMFTYYTTTPAASQRVLEFIKFKKAFEKYAIFRNLPKTDLIILFPENCFYCEMTNDVFLKPDYVNS